MIAVDTSALIAIVLDEPDADRCEQALLNEAELVISAVTLSEALIVAGRLDRSEEMSALLDGLPLDIIPASEAFARRVAAAYERWGKGRHPARLNWGDCFSYVAAWDRGCPLLYVGDDFTKTDLASA
jgi:ribonuclease VapC